MPTLTLLVGLPRSGKSTWAREQYGVPIVCPDAIRLALHGQSFVATAEPMVWAIARLMAASLFLAGNETVILDACNVTKARRLEWVDERWDTSPRVFEEDAETCKARAIATDREDLLPVIDRMADEFEWPEEDEY